jgi:hypothetical protein
MPKKNMGLALELTRYHRIGSPTDEARVLHDRPLECALCHQDKSVTWMVEAMERLWHKSYPRAPLVALYGSLDANVVEATLVRGLPHEQAVAAALSPSPRAIAPLLGHAYPLVRHFARRVLERLVGHAVDVDLDAPQPALPAGLD